MNENFNISLVDVYREPQSDLIVCVRWFATSITDERLNVLSTTWKKATSDPLLFQGATVESIKEWVLLNAQLPDIELIKTRLTNMAKDIHIDMPRLINQLPTV